MNDNSAEIRTNPVFMTAKTAVCLMAYAGIPNAEDIMEKLELSYDNIPGMRDEQMILGNALVVESKYRTMCRLISESGLKTEVDLPCGYTPKAIHMTDKGIDFIGLDLPIAAEEAGAVIAPMADRSDKIRFCGVDATNYESLKKALGGVTGEICITTEGMMMYFTDSEASAVVSNIKKLLEEHSGCWITPDPEYAVQFFLTFSSVMGEEAVQKLIETKKSAAGQSDVAALQNSFIVDPTDPVNGIKKVSDFLDRHHLKAERINLGEIMPELSVYDKLSSEQIARFREAMKKCCYWKITLAKDDNMRDTINSTPFGFEFQPDGQGIMLKLCGRVDTLTAPEILRAFEEKDTAEFSSVTVDCSDMEYISSAGLRVLMIMHKNTNEGIRLIGVNDNVREILEQTGFDSIFGL